LSFIFSSSLSLLWDGAALGMLFPSPLIPATFNLRGLRREAPPRTPGRLYREDKNQTCGGDESFLRRLQLAVTFSAGAPRFRRLDEPRLNVSMNES
jgi:hypothetical protein